MPDIHSLSYLSKAVRPLTESEVEDLARVAAGKNACIGVTGHLYAHTGHYFQYLEGDEAALRSVMKSIASDPRHQILTTVDLGRMHTHRFPTWSMRYLSTTALDKMGLEHILFELMQDVLKGTYCESWMRDNIVKIMMRLARFQSLLNRGGSHGKTV